MARGESETYDEAGDRVDCGVRAGGEKGGRDKSSGEGVHRDEGGKKKKEEERWYCG